MLINSLIRDDFTKKFNVISQMFICAILCAFYSTTVFSSPLKKAACSLAITDVNVIPMDSERVVKHQTLLISGKHISAIGLSKNLSAENCQHVINGEGRYLMPGLNDMHTHLESVAFDKAFGKKPTPINYEDVLASYLANGITGLRILSGSPDLLKARNEINENNLALPHLVVASPMLTGEAFLLPEPITSIIDDAEIARKKVNEYATAGYDLIKIRRNLSKVSYMAVLDEANMIGIDVDGHLSTKTGDDFYTILQSGQDGFAHVDELASKAARTPEGFDKTIELLVKCECYVSSTIAIFQNVYDMLDNYEKADGRAAMRHVHPQWKQGFWSKSKNPYFKERPPKDIFPKIAKRSREFLKQFYDAGGMVLAGSDSLNPMMIPGTGMHDELAELTKAGLTTFQTLTTTTSYPNKAIKQFAEIGLIKNGFIANLLLIKNNPLDDLKRIKTADFVIINGHALSREELDKNLQTAVIHFDKLKSEYIYD